MGAVDSPLPGPSTASTETGLDAGDVRVIFIFIAGQSSFPLGDSDQVKIVTHQAMLHSTDHQILYGRRGTGKTHALLYLSDLIERTGDVAVYLDLRTIGSAGGMYTDSNLSPAVRGTHLLVDTLEAIHEELLVVALERDIGDQHDLLLALDALAETATAVQVVGEVERETTLGGSAESSVGIELTVSPNAKVSATQHSSATAE
ncbi:MAG: hypothetical protein ACRDRZ_14815, partial [Pseudonocardiaceae bacterium]